jgi:hypothetical protein
MSPKQIANKESVSPIMQLRDKRIINEKMREYENKMMESKARNTSYMEMLS